MWYTMIKRYYDNGHPAYTDENLKTFVVAGMITADEYYKITGKQYTTETAGTEETEETTEAEEVTE